VSLEVALAELATLPRILVGSDFDGTLSELVDRPADARPLPGVERVLRRLLGSPGVTLVVVSGRRLDFLEAQLGGIESLVLIGEHGAAHRGAALDRPARFDEVRDGLESLAAEYDGAWVEVKHTAFALHTRALTGDVEIELFRRAEDLLDDLAPGTHHRGRRVLDVRLADATKGQAIEALRERTDAVFFAGDDTTDESVFESARPGDVMVKVGSGETAASHRVRGPAELVEVLETLAELRT